MLIAVFLFVGFGLLYVGAEALVRGGTRLALRFGLTPLVVGLTVVAFGTSSPELVVSLQAALADRGAIALGNVVGSNVCNVALIMGLSALIRPLRIQLQLIRLDVPVVVGCSVLLLAFLADQRIGRGEGAVLVLGIVAYVAFNIWQARGITSPAQEEGAGEAVQERPLWIDGGLIVIGLATLAGGAHLFVEGAILLARALDIGEAVIGLTIVAVGTSLPELATSVVAAVKGEGDIAIGNVVGSNAFNILGILGPVALVHPIRGSGVGWLDLGVMLGVTVLLLPLMWSGFQLNRWEGGLLLAVYVAYTSYLLVG